MKLGCKEDYDGTELSIQNKAPFEITA